MERIEEFCLDGKNFIYVDFSGLKSGEEFTSHIELIKPLISEYPKLSLNMITNIADIRVDSILRKIALEYLKYNEPYIKCSVVIGLDGIKKMLIDKLLKLSGRKNIFCAFSKEKAIEWALRQE